MNKSPAILLVVVILIPPILFGIKNDKGMTNKDVDQNASNARQSLLNRDQEGNSSTTHLQLSGAKDAQDDCRKHYSDPADTPTNPLSLSCIGLINTVKEIEGEHTHQ